MLIIKEVFDEAGIEQIRQLYEKAFPASEKKPFSLIVEKRATGAVEILAIEDEKKQFKGLIITILHKDMVLIDYFAIEEEYRGTGIGSDALKLFTARYAKHRVFLEIESTVSENVEEYDLKIRRKAFYQKNRLAPMNFLVDLFGVEMEVMTFHCDITFEEYQEMLAHVYGEKVRDKVRFIKYI